MKILKISAIAIGSILIVLVGFVAWVWSQIQLPADIDASHAVPRGDVVLSEFFVPPGNPPQDPGVLVRQKVLEGSAVLAEASENIGIMYSSTEGLSGAERNVVSGALYLPAGEPPEEGWPLLVWSHGTVGIGDRCAPSFAGRGERDPQYLNPWLEKGYAIAASDYQGLGTPGTHPYMDARTMAFNNLDLIRAVQSAEFPLSDKVVIAGQSQGATGALASASYAESYAPDIDIGGIIATGIPHFSYSIIWDLASKSDPDEVSASLPLSLYMLAFAEMLDPDFELDTIISDKAKPVVSEIDQTCVFDFIGASQNAGLSSSNTFVSRPDLELIKVFSRTNLPHIGIQIPVFAGSGTADKITPIAMQLAFIADACEAGANISAKTYSGANHNEGLLQSTLDAQSFADTVLSGGDIEVTCAD